MSDLDESHILFKKLNNTTVPIYEVGRHIAVELLPNAGAKAIFIEQAKDSCIVGSESAICDAVLQAQLSAALPVSNRVHAVEYDPESELDSGPPTLKRLQFRPCCWQSHRDSQESGFLIR